MNIWIRWIVLGVFATALGLALSPAALGDDSAYQIVTVSRSSGCTGFLVQTLDGTVTGCGATPAEAGPIPTATAAAANGSIAYSDTNAGQVADGGPIWLTSSGGNLIELDSSPFDLEPSISYDGSKVTFVRFDPVTSSSDVYTVNSDGSGLTLIASGGGTNFLRLPTFSPDSGTIAYWCGPASPDPTGPGCGPLTDGSYRLSGAMRMNADGSDQRMIVIGPGLADQPVGPNSLSWSPDAQWLGMDGDTGNQQAFVYHTDGSDLFNNIDPTRQVTHETDLSGAWFPQFCGNSQQIVYLKTIDDGGNEGNFAFLINTDGTNRHELFLSTEGTPWGVCVLPATGEAPPPLVDMTHVVVPSVDALDVGAATSKLQAVNLTVGTVSYAYSAAVGKDLVASQDPSAGAVAHRTEKRGPPVNLVVSLGPAPTVQCVVPRVRGESLKATRRAMAAAHCEVGRIKRAYSRTVKKGRVVSERPGPGRHLHEGAKVALTVSKGKRP